jgi:hypothetical protein
MSTNMNHDPFVDRLSDYLDGEDLGTSDRAAIESHLATCASCRGTLAELRQVAARAASLPASLPASDLWPGVAARLTAPARVADFEGRRATRRFSFTLPQLVAAGLALMVLSGGLAWIAKKGGERTSAPPIVADVGDTLLLPTNFAESDYNRAITDLEAALDAGRSRLDPDTIRILEANLRAIDVAIDQSRKALSQDPGNTHLANYFASARNRKLTLLRRASALTMNGS